MPILILHECRYAADMEYTLSKAPIMADVQAAKKAHGDVQLQYSSPEHYAEIAGMLGWPIHWVIAWFCIPCHASGAMLHDGRLGS